MPVVVLLWLFFDFLPLNNVFFNRDRAKILVHSLFDFVELLPGLLGSQLSISGDSIEGTLAVCKVLDVMIQQRHRHSFWELAFSVIGSHLQVFGLAFEQQFAGIKVFFTLIDAQSRLAICCKVRRPLWNGNLIGHIVGCCLLKK